MKNASLHVLISMVFIFTFIAASYGAEDPFGSTGFSRNTTIIEAPGPDQDCPGLLLCNWDGTVENGYCWQFGGAVPPDYGAWAECYGEAFICEAHFYFTQTGYYIGQTMDLYVWEAAGGYPGNVIFVGNGLPPGPIAYWPSCSAHKFSINIDAPDHFIGFWGNWPGLQCGWFVCSDEDGFPGCPVTKFAPGIGYPTGWGPVNLVPIFQPQALGLCEWAIPTGTGACCIGAECFEVSQAECQAMGGEWSLGTCVPNPCIGACCLDEECIITYEDSCLAVGGEWDGSPSCDPNPCLPLGACCVGEDCFEITQPECQAMGGEWAEGVSCDPNPCVGACCVDEECIQTSEENCLAMGGEWINVSCDPNPCNTGACCVDEECFLVSEAECQAMGGEWDGSPSCEPNPCLPTGACCVDEECSQTTEDECLAMGGEWSEGVSCTPNPCVGACCFEQDCVLHSEENCLAMGGEWHGSPSCYPNPCDPIGACCFANLCVELPESECLDLGGEWDGSPSCDPNPCINLYEGVVLSVHGNVQCVETNGDPCGAIELPDACEETDPNACPDASGIEWYIAFAAAENELAFTTITFGIGDYDPYACSMAAFGPCHPDLGPLEISSDEWPGPSSGTSVTWAPNCLQGMLVPVYYFGFYVYYGGGSVPLGDFFPGQSPAIVSCDDPPVEIPIEGFGAMGCGDNPGVQACPHIGPIPAACCVDANGDGNPETCILVQSEEECESQGGIYQGDGTFCGPNDEPCPPDPVATRKTTWGRIKAMYRD